MNNDRSPFEFESEEDIPIVQYVRESPYRGIGGWLVLPFLGLIISIFVHLVSLFSDHFGVYTEGDWDCLTDPASRDYHPAWASYLVTATIFQVLFISYLMVTFWYFIQMSRLTPRLMIIAYSVALVVMIGKSIFVAHMLPGGKESAECERDLVLSIITCVIWIPYFCVSARVAATFTAEVPRRRKTEDSQARDETDPPRF